MSSFRMFVRSGAGMLQSEHMQKPQASVIQLVYLCPVPRPNLHVHGNSCTYPRLSLEALAKEEML